MGTTLTGTTPQDTYDSLIKVTDNGPLSGTAKYLSDGLGNDSALALSTSMVGINTTTPSLQGFNNELTISSGVSGTKRTALNLQGSRTTASTFASIGFYHQANFVASVESSRGGADNSASLEFFTSDAGTNAERMRITSAGNVGIGTSAPNKKLHVVGPVSVTSTTSVLSSSDTGIYASHGSVAANYNGIFFQGISSKDMYFGRKGEAGIDDLVVSTAEASPVEIVRFRRDGGITFNGDTAAANALDDYEEGTWSPQVYYQNTTDQANATNVTQVGTYTKIGRLVTITCVLQWTITGSPASDNIGVKNLPFASTAGADYIWFGPCQMVNAGSYPTDGFKIYMNQNSSLVLLYDDRTDSGNYGATVGASGTKTLRFSFTYSAS